MPTVGPYYPTSYATRDLFGEAWVNPTNVYADNGLYATVSTTPGVTTEHSPDGLNLGGFGVSIPSSATIDGVEVKLRWKCSHASAGSKYFVPSIYSTWSLRRDAGTICYKSMSATEVPTSEATFTVGGPLDTWSHTAEVTPAMLNDASLYLYWDMRCRSDDGVTSVILSVQWVTLTVYYTAGYTNSVSGVPASGIASRSGIPIAKIGSISGV